MPNQYRCFHQPCEDTPSYKMVREDGYVVGALCADHKESWYDAREDHKTRLVKIRNERRSHEVDQEHTPDRTDSISLLAERAEGDARPSGGRDNPGRVVSGAGDCDLAPIPPLCGGPSDTASRASALDLRPPHAGEEKVRQHGNLLLTGDEMRLLSAPPDPNIVEIRPDGIVYVPWNEVANRLDAGLGIGQWSLVPDGKPMIQDGYCCWQFDLWVHGQWVTTAIGEHPEHKFSKMSLANRAESAKSDALVKCSKSLGIFRELWSPGWRMAWQEKHAIRVWALQTERSTAGQWLWRRNDRPPFFKERPAKDSMETEYHKRRDHDDEARDHFDAIARGD